jgi:hypothetical protein
MLRSRQKPRFLPAATKPMSEKRSPTAFLMDQQQPVGLALALLRRPQKSHLLRPATKLMSEKRPRAVFPID